MAVYDILMLCLIAMTTLRGSTKGIAWQLAGIVSLVLCFIFATPLSANLAPLVPLQAPLNRWAAMLGVYLLFSFGCFSIARMFRGALESAKFEAFDKHLGAMFGFIKGITLCLVITFFAVCMSDAAADYILRTNTGYVTARAMQQLEPMLPPEVANVLRKAAGQPAIELDPLLAQQQQQMLGPDGLPINDPNLQNAPLPGAAPGYDVWREPGDDGEAPLGGSAPLYPPNGNQPQPYPAPGATQPQPLNPTGTAPLSRADFFRPAGAAVGSQSAGGAAPPIADVLSKVPQVLNSNGSIADKTIGALRSLLPGNSSSPPQLAPPSNTAPYGNQPPRPTNAIGNQFAPSPIGANPPSLDEESQFSPPIGMPQNPTARTAVPPSATLPGDNEVPFRDVGGTPSGTQTYSRDPRSFDEEPVSPRNAAPPISNLPNRRRDRFEEDEPQRSPINPRTNSSAGSMTRVAPAPGVAIDDPFSRDGGPAITPRSRPATVTDIAPGSRFDQDEEPISSRTAPPPSNVSPRSAPIPSELISSPDEFGRRGAAVTPFSGRSAPISDSDLRSGRGMQIRPGENRQPRDRTEEIRQLTSGIAVLLSPPSGRPTLEAEIQQSIERVPQNIAAAALRDWQADLMGKNPDPIPESDVSTPMPMRLRLAKEARDRRKAAAAGANSAGGAMRENRPAPPPLDRF